MLETDLPRRLLSLCMRPLPRFWAGPMMMVVVSPCVLPAFSASTLILYAVLSWKVILDAAE